ncbi:MAG: hypothetical protein WC414_04270 [Patescibacteria group bacterium]
MTHEEILFKKTKKLIKDGETEHYKIEHFVLSPEFVKKEKLFSAFGGANSYREVRDLEPGEYVKLIKKEHDDIVMSDTPMELETNSEFIDNAKGDILIGGLGLGLIVMSVQSRKNIKSITIVEKEKEIIELLKDFPFNTKVKIINDDIYNYIPEKKFDYIYFDIWNTISSDNYDDMKKLHRTFRKYLNKDGTITSWRYEDCKYQKYRERKEERRYSMFA